MRSPLFLLAMLLALPGAATADPLAHTFSIVARDAQTGELGVAVQSHWFSVGSIVTWAEAGVGAIATQSFVDPGYGQRALELLKHGVSAPDALAQLIAADKQRDVRQVAVIDAQGRVAAHTGAKAIVAAGHHVGAQYSVQALRRLVRLQRAYNRANRGDELMSEQKIDDALKEYAAAASIAPEIVELPFWHAVTLAFIGREAEAKPIFEAVFAREPVWAELVPRLPAAGLLPDDKALIDRIVALVRFSKE